jgi:histidinol-phosphate aminotransferase
VARLLADAPPALVMRYPTPYADELRAALATRLGVAPEQVLTGCGSDDLLDAALRAFSGPGDRVAYAPPTFGVLPAFAAAAGALPLARPRRADLTLDVQALLATRAAVTYLCSPDNPLGMLHPAADVARLATGDGLLVLDEAYAEYAGGGLLAPHDRVARGAAGSRNVLLLRTLSKAWGLAGLRVGYAVGPAAVVAAVEAARGPFKVGALAEAAALAVLRADDDWAAAGVREVAASRGRLVAELTDRGLAPLPSAANFVFVPLPVGTSATVVAAELRRRGVGVRAFDGLPVVGSGIRVGLGPWDAMERFLAALDGALAAGLVPGTPVPVREVAR